MASYEEILSNVGEPNNCFVTIHYGLSMSEEASNIANELTRSNIPTFCATIWRLRHLGENAETATITAVKKHRCKVIIFLMTKDWQTDAKCQQLANAANKALIASIHTEKRIIAVRYDNQESDKNFDKGYDERQAQHWLSRLQGEPILSSNPEWKQILIQNVKNIVKNSKNSTCIPKHESMIDHISNPFSLHQHYEATKSKIVIDSLNLIHYPSPNHLFDTTTKINHHQSIKYLVNKQNYSKLHESFNDQHVTISEGIPTYQEKQIIKNSHVRVLAWVAEGVDEVQRLNRDVYRRDSSKEIISLITEVMPETIIICMEFGSIYVTEEILLKELREQGIDSTIIVVTASPFQKSIGDFLSLSLLPFIQVVLRDGATEACRNDKMSCFNRIKFEYICSVNDVQAPRKNFKEKYIGFKRHNNHKGIKMVSSIHETIAKYEDGLRIASSFDIVLDYRLKDLTLKLKDMDTFVECKRNILQEIARGHQSDNMIYYFTIEKDGKGDCDRLENKRTRLENYNNSDETTEFYLNAKKYDDTRALAYFLCNSLSEDFPIVRYIKTKEELTSLFSEISIQTSRVLLWLDCTPRYNSSNLSNEDITGLFSDETIEKICKFTCLVTGLDNFSTNTVVHDKNLIIEKKITEDLDDNSMGSITTEYTELSGILKVIKNYDSKESWDTFLTAETLNQLKEILVDYDLVTAAGSDVLQVYRDNQRSICIRISVISIEQLKMLMQKIIYNQRKMLKELFKTSNESFSFDITSFFQLYDNLALKLEKETAEQGKAIKICENHNKVHITGPAGSGKTFVALGCIRRCIEYSPKNKILYICPNIGLAYHLARWNYHRTKTFNCSQAQDINNQSMRRIYYHVTGDSECKEESIVRDVSCSSLNINDDSDSDFTSESEDDTDRESPYFQILVDEANPNKLKRTEHLAVDKIPKRFDLGVLDEAQNILGYEWGDDYSLSDSEDESVLHQPLNEEKRIEILEILKSIADSRLVVLSDQSQASVNDPETLAFSILPFKFDAVENLTTITRASKAASLGSCSYTACGASSITCKHDFDGPKIKSILFESTKLTVDRKHEVYAEKLVDTIACIEGEFPMTDFNLRIAILVPNDEFKMKLEKSFLVEDDDFSFKRVNVLEGRKNELEKDYYAISAEEYAKYLHYGGSVINQDSSCHRQRCLIVLDTVESFSGMEIMMVIVTHLDGPAIIKMDEGQKYVVPDPNVRSQIYKSMTRAHLGVHIVNEIVHDGMFEWLVAMQPTLSRRKTKSNKKRLGKRKSFSAPKPVDLIKFDSAKDQLEEFHYSSRGDHMNSRDATQSKEMTINSPAFAAPKICIPYNNPGDIPPTPQSHLLEPIIISFDNERVFVKINDWRDCAVSEQIMQVLPSKCKATISFEWMETCHSNTCKIRLILVHIETKSIVATTLIDKSPSSKAGYSEVNVSLLSDQHEVLGKIKKGHKLHLQVKTGEKETLAIRNFHFFCSTALTKKHFLLPKFLPLRTPETRLQDAASLKKWDEVKSILAECHKNVNVNYCDPDFSLLHYAAGDGNVEICSMLLSFKSININSLNNRGSTPLDLAIANGRNEVKKLLVERGAFANRSDRSKEEER